MLQTMMPKGQQIMAAEVVVLAKRCGFKVGLNDFTEAEKREMWAMRARGVTPEDIAKTFNAPRHVIYNATKGFAPKKQKVKQSDDLPSTAWSQQIVAHLKTLKGVAINLTRDPGKAEDLVQETVLKAMQREANFTQGTNLGAWLNTVMRNIYLEQMRRKKREVEDADGSYAARMMAPPEQGHRFDLERLLEAINQLPGAQAESLRLVVFEGLTYDEVADELECNVGTVKSRVSRAREKLAQFLHADGSPFATDGLMAACTMD